jgi:hypothetical protein
MSDVDLDLPPTQELILEVLAARHRLGETVWPFSNRCAKAAAVLEGLGLITTIQGNVPRTFRAMLTEVGITAILDPEYVPPIARDHGRPSPSAGWHSEDFDPEASVDPAWSRWRAAKASRKAARKAARRVRSEGRPLRDRGGYPGPSEPVTFLPQVPPGPAPGASSS